MNKSTLLLSILLGLAVPVFALADEEKAPAADELFGGGGGYFHPYITTSGLYDDNVYRTSADKIGDSAMVYSPGIWIAVPGTREKRPSLTTSTLTPGGLGIVEDRGESFQHFEGFLHYGAELTRFQQEDDNDTDDQRLEGLFQMNLKGGLSFELLDMYLDGHDERGEGAFGQLDTYKSNLLGGRMTYDLGAKFRVRGEYSRYTINYDSNENSYLDRIDDKYAAFLYYKLSGKSSAFVEYDLVDISYDQYAQLDSKEHIAWGGYRWRLSEKTMGEVKVGYLTKDNALDGADDTSDWVVQGWLDYVLTGKSRFKLTAARLVEEPDAFSTESATTNEVKLAFIHDLTAKIRANVEGGYGRTSYEGEYVYQDEIGSREDDKYSGRVALNYQIQDWLGVKASYTYLDKESSFSGLSYTDNRFLLSLSLAL